MYLSHFNLQEKPFKVTADPKFLWVGEKHKNTLETLRYGILHGDGYVVLTGDVGTGKTTLAMALTKGLSDNMIVASVAYPDVDVLDFLKLIAAAYGIKTDIQSKASFRYHFELFLRSCFLAGKKAVLILDEAQRMGHEHLEELLQMCSIQENGAGLLNIVLVGQNELNDILQEDRNRALRQRISAFFNLLPLTLAETEEYIFHRLNIVHSQREIFSRAAIQEIFLHSNGIPRLINIICDLSLLTTFMEGEEVVQPGAVKRSAERLRLPRERAEFAAKGTDHSPPRGGKPGDESPPKRGELQREVRREEAGRTVNGKLIWTAGVALMVVLVGMPLPVGREANHPEGGTLSEQRGQEGNAGQAEMKISPSEEGADRPIVFPSESSPLIQAEKALEPSATKKDSLGSEVEPTGKKPSAQARKAETRKVVVSKAAGEPPVESSREPSHRIQPLSGGDQKVGLSSVQSPSPLTGFSVREFSEKEAGEAEPGGAIDWILEKRDKN